MSEVSFGSPQPLDHCPLCGHENACAMAQADNLGSGCWCMSVTFAPEVLERIAGGRALGACICAACAMQPDPGS